MDVETKVNPWVLALTPYQPGKPITELQRELGITEVIKLASNENPLGPSPKAIQALKNLKNLELAIYPDGNGYDLKVAIVNKYKLEFNQITLGSGSDDIFNFIVRSFLQPGDEVIIDEFAFAAFPIAVKAVGATVVSIKSNNFKVEPQALIDACKNNAKAKILYLANPNNPTGTGINKLQFEYLLENIPSNILVIIDEAYYEYASVYSADFPYAFNYLDKYPNLIVTRTFSKAYGLAGFRVGFSACSPELVDIINRIRLPFNVNSLGLIAATESLQDEQHIKDTVSSNEEGLKYFYAQLDALGLEYIRSIANFVTIDMATDEMVVFNKLLEQGIIVRPLGPYGMGNYLRVTVGLQEQNEKFFVALKNII